MNFGDVAQLARASACRAEGCEFEPRRPRNVQNVNFQEIVRSYVAGTFNFT